MSGLRRRDFLRTATRLGALAGIGGALPFAHHSVFGAGAGDYRALVCVLLAGGADSFNLLVPRNSIDHGEYQSRRGDLALDVNSLLPIGATQGAVEFGLHPLWKACIHYSSAVMGRGFRILVLW